MRAHAVFKACISLVALPLLVCVQSCGPAKDTTSDTTVNYRETLQWERNGKSFTASGVMQSRLALSFGGIGPYSGGRGVSVLRAPAEAIPIEVGEGDYVFALPTYPYGGDKQRRSILYAACNLPPDDSNRDLATLRKFVQLVVTLDRPCDVPVDSWPILVHFSDRTRWETAERIFPSDLQTRFGVSLTAVRVERTDDPPSTGIASLLPWLLDTQTHWMPVKTVEKSPRSRPIVLDQTDFQWPTPAAKGRGEN